MLRLGLGLGLGLGLRPKVSRPRVLRPRVPDPTLTLKIITTYPCRFAGSNRSYVPSLNTCTGQSALCDQSLETMAVRPRQLYMIQHQ